MEPSNVIPIATLIANFGFSGFACWWLLTKAIPAMQDRFSEDLKAQRDDNQQMMKLEREGNERERQLAVTSMERMLSMMAKDQVEILRRTSDTANSTYLLVQELVKTAGARK